MRKSAIITALALCCMSASANEAASDQTPSQDHSAAAQPIGGGKAVTTTKIRRCPEGRELVIRADGRRGCAKDVVPAND